MEAELMEEYNYHYTYTDDHPEQVDRLDQKAYEKIGAEFMKMINGQGIFVVELKKYTWKEPSYQKLTTVVAYKLIVQK
jgi:hypothetical protein